MINSRLPLKGTSWAQTFHSCWRFAYRRRRQLLYTLARQLFFVFVSPSVCTHSFFSTLTSVSIQSDTTHPNPIDSTLARARPRTGPFSSHHDQHLSRPRGCMPYTLEAHIDQIHSQQSQLRRYVWNICAARRTTSRMAILESMMRYFWIPAPNVPVTSNSNLTLHLFLLTFGRRLSYNPGFLRARLCHQIPRSTMDSDNVRYIPIQLHPQGLLHCFVSVHSVFDAEGLCPDP